MSHCAVNTKAIKCLMRSILIEKERRRWYRDRFENKLSKIKLPAVSFCVFVWNRTNRSIIFEILFKFSRLHCFFFFSTPLPSNSHININQRQRARRRRMLQGRIRRVQTKSWCLQGSAHSFSKSLDQTQKDPYLLSQAKSKPLPFSGRVTSCVSHCNFSKQSSNEDYEGIRHQIWEGADTSVTDVTYKAVTSLQEHLQGTMNLEELKVFLQWGIESSRDIMASTFSKGTGTFEHFWLVKHSHHFILATIFQSP